MDLPDSAPTTFGLFRALQRPDCGLLPRLAASLITCLGYAAFAPLCAGLLDIAPRRNFDGDVVMWAAVSVLALAWFATLLWIWRGFSRRVQVLRATLLTAAVVWVAGTAGVLVDYLLRNGEEYLIASIMLLAAAAVVLIWTPVGMHFMRGRSVVRGDGVVDVTCPTCGYLLVGLSELRCPECGTKFTIDSLIKAQQYSSRTP
jgi:hypothetical protein